MIGSVAFKQGTFPCQHDLIGVLTKDSESDWAWMGRVQTPTRSLLALVQEEEDGKVKKTGTQRTTGGMVKLKASVAPLFAYEEIHTPW